jgi:hypothetical protein
MYEWLRAVIITSRRAQTNNKLQNRLGAKQPLANLQQAPARLTRRRSFFSLIILERVSYFHYVFGPAPV